MLCVTVECPSIYFTHGTCLCAIVALSVCASLMCVWLSMRSDALLLLRNPVDNVQVNLPFTDANLRTSLLNG